MTESILISAESGQGTGVLILRPEAINNAQTVNLCDFEENKSLSVEEYLWMVWKTEFLKLTGCVR